jgi:ribosomal protein S18 acetylase RimI-like enzyme
MTNMRHLRGGMEEKMTWDYVELSAPEKSVDSLINYDYDATHAKATIRRIMENKKEYIALLLIGDEQEDMLDKYIERGEMFVLDDDGIKAECVVTQESNGVYEIKNIAVLPDCQQKGYGKNLINFLISYYTDCNTLIVGTIYFAEKLFSFTP